jgi:N6-L-threonylcarbamoyladenine synthase
MDTSCYTTSIAILEGQKCLLDLRMPIKVPAGDIGLRQSDILFQHTQNLTQMMESIKGSFPLESVHVVGFSDAPRSQENSYMPVFLAGRSIATAMATALNCPLMSFSHQDGHLAAIQLGSPLRDSFMAMHLSGGTTEIVRVKRNQHFGYDVEVIGGTLDISFGQLIDRIGVYSGLPFPSGCTMDFEAIKSAVTQDFITIQPELKNGFFNVSGYENKIKKILDSEVYEPRDVYKSLLMGIAKTLIRLTQYCSMKDEPILIAGGVSASLVVRETIANSNFSQKPHIQFGSPALSTDNAVGTALLAAEAFIKGGIGDANTDY